MTLHLRTLVSSLLLLPILLSGCKDDPSGPTDEIYSLQSVSVDGRVSPPPVLLREGRIPISQGSSVTTPYRYELRRGLLLLRKDGRYEFTGFYQVLFPEFDEIDEFVAEEEGTYVRRGNTVTFNPTSGEAYLSTTGTADNMLLTVNVTDPIFERSNPHTFSR